MADPIINRFHDYAIVEMGKILSDPGKCHNEPQEWPLISQGKFRIVKDSWRFDWKYTEFPWEKSRRFSLCYYYKDYLWCNGYRHSYLLINNPVSDPSCWWVVETWTMETFATLDKAVTKIRYSEKYCRESDPADRISEGLFLKEHKVDPIHLRIEIDYS